MFLHPLSGCNSPLYRVNIARSSSSVGSVIVVSVSLALSTALISIRREQANFASRLNRYGGNRILLPDFSVTIIAYFTQFVIFLFL